LDVRWTIMLRSLGIASLACLPLVIFVPESTALVAFGLLSLPINGPLSPLLPTAWEPLIIQTTEYYHPVVVATVGFFVYMYMEYINFYVYRWVLSRRRLAALQQKPAVQRAVALFGRRPFLTVFIFALTPLPFWAGRVLAIWHKYPLRPFMLATALGRYPRILAYAWIGNLLDLPGWLLLLVGAGIPLILITLKLARRKQLMDDPVVDDPSTDTSMDAPVVDDPSTDTSMASDPLAKQPTTNASMTHELSANEALADKPSTHGAVASRPRPSDPVGAES
jgi:uncharacterized membrane protein YdjX (TVP38/TMEM64 family)